MIKVNFLSNAGVLAWLNKDNNLFAAGSIIGKPKHIISQMFQNLSNPGYNRSTDEKAYVKKN